MRLNKILVASTLALPAAIAPMSVMTSCSNTWGYKTPINFGAADRTDPNNPYYYFAKDNTEANKYLDLDGLAIPSYLQSNYIIDNKNSVNYAYTMPVDKWYETKDKKNYKLETSKWTDATAVWASPSTSLSTTCTQIVEDGGKNWSITQSCNKNLALTANISFVDSIGTFISKFITYAISYLTSQMFNNDDFAVAWGGKIPSFVGKERELYEWIYANSNAYAVKKTQAYLKTTNANFNFLNFPIPSYTFDKKISTATTKLLTGSETSSLGENASTIYWTTKSEQGSGDDKYTVYTYPSVPVLIRTKDIVQRFVNPQKNDSFFVSEFYQNDMNVIKNAVGNNWDSMNNKLPEEKKQKDHVTPKYYKYDITCPQEAKTIGIEESNTDARLRALNPQGNDFIAFITYSYVHWDKANEKLNRRDTVSLSSLNTVMPAYMLETKSDLFVKANKDKNNSGYIVDLTKADKYSTELINLLSRNSTQGRVAKATDLSKESKDYLKFLTYLFAKNSGEFTFDFIKPE